MKKIVYLCLIVTLAITTVACAGLRFPGVYRLKILQGNYLEQEMADQLEVGMTKRQVRYVMGTPLIQDTFNPDRWDYYFAVRHDGKELKEYHFTVYFEGDSLSHWEGNYEPSQQSAEEEQAEALKTTEKKEAAKFK